MLVALFSDPLRKPKKALGKFQGFLWVFGWGFDTAGCTVRGPSSANPRWGALSAIHEE